MNPTKNSVKNGGVEILNLLIIINIVPYIRRLNIYFTIIGGETA